MLDILEQLEHPNIVKAHESFRHPVEYADVAVLEFLSGDSLDKVLKNSKTARRNISRKRKIPFQEIEGLSLEQSLKIIRDISDAVAYLHVSL